MAARFPRTKSFNCIITIGVILLIATLEAADESGCPKPNIDYGHETHRSGKPLLFPRTQYREGFTVFLSCNPGYTMEGSKEIQCGPNSEWNKPLPSCIPITCSKPHVPDGYITPQTGGGMTLKAEYIFSDTVKLQCDIGYITRGRSEIECGSDGKWSALPTCKPVFCQAPKVKNGHIIPKHASETLGAGYRFSNAVKVHCDTGYVVRGGSEIRCESDGKWSALPTCEPVTCPKPHVPDGYITPQTGGGMTLKAEYIFLDTVKLQCDIGYIMRGRSEIECGSDGKWSALPTCKSVTCPKPHVPDGYITPQTGGGMTLKAEYIFLDTVKLQCDIGYIMRGRSEIECGSDGKWSALPTCKSGNCPSPPRLDSGELTDASLTVTAFPVGTTLTYQCRPGHVRTPGNTNSVTCLATSAWSEIEEFCERNCPSPPRLDSGELTDASLTVTAFPVGTTLTYQCRPGHVRTPGNTNSVTCLATSSWSEIEEFCERNCPSPPRLDSGELTDALLTVTAFPVGTTLTYQCRPGYVRTLGKTNSITCLATSTWSEIEEFCERNCPWPPRLDYGEVTEAALTVTGIPVGTRLIYQCHPGYVRTPGKTNSITCLATSAWSEIEDFCERRDCGNPGIPLNGAVVLSSIPGTDEPDTKFGATATFTCDVGFILFGSSIRTCTADGWDNVVSHCKAVTCPKPPDINNGMHTSMGQEEFQYQNVVTYSCNSKTFSLLGEASIHCTEAGIWSGPPPRCEVVICPKPPDIKNGMHTSMGEEEFHYQNSVTYSCNSKTFSLIGEASIHCTEDGIWSGLPPRCEVIRCTDPDVPNVRRTSGFGSSHTFKDSIGFECKPGFVMNGSRLIECGEDNEWHPPVPECQLVICEAPPSIANGGHSDSDKTEFLYESEVQYSCNDATFTLLGDPVLSCTRYRTWSGPPPTCKVISCSDPSVANAVKTSGFESGPFKHGESITFECNKGFTMKGPATVTCSESSAWSPALPKCDKVVAHCGPPTVLQFARVNKRQEHADTFPVGSTVSYICIRGYVKISGKTSAITCYGDSKWSEISEFCKLRSCGSPGEMNNGWVEVNETVVGSIATFFCDKGYRMAGSRSHRQCLEDGLWSNAVPHCESVLCEQPPDIPNAGHSGKGVNEFTYLTSVTYYCKAGALHGENSIYCTEHGNWSGPGPECIDVSCAVPIVRDGILQGGYASRVPYGGIIELKCNRGYRPERSTTFQCGRDGSWHPALPVCVPDVSCPVPTVQNGIMYSGYASPVPYGNLIEFQCNTDYRPEHRTSIQCGRDGRWYPAPPVCVHISRICPTPEVKNGYIKVPRSKELTFGVGYRYSDTVEMVCEIGFMMKGSAKIKCVLSGNWSPTLPTCEPVSCYTPQVNHGNVILNRDGEMMLHLGRTFTGTVNVQCHAGYLLHGESEIRCDNFGRQSAVPRCESVTCPLPEPGPARFVVVIYRHSYPYVSYGYPKRIKVYCEPGYVISGRSEIWCEADGQWSTTIPTCEPVTCPTPDVKHGQIILNSKGDMRLGAGYKFKDSVTVQCDTGYMVCGGREIHCEVDGKWSPTVPTCEHVASIQHHSMRIPERNIQTIQNAYMADEGGRVCAEKFLPLGRQEVMCTEEDTVDLVLATALPASAISANALCESVERTMKDHWKKMNVEDKYLHLEMGKLCLDIISLHLQIEKLNATLTPSKSTWWQRATSIGFS